MASKKPHNLTSLAQTHGLDDLEEEIDQCQFIDSSARKATSGMKSEGYPKTLKSPKDAVRSARKQKEKLKAEKLRNQPDHADERSPRK